MIRAYSAQTSDFVLEFEEADQRIVDIALHPDFPNIVIGCTDKELIFWDCQNGVITKRTVSQISQN